MYITCQNRNFLKGTLVVTITDGHLDLEARNHELILTKGL